MPQRIHDCSRVKSQARRAVSSPAGVNVMEAKVDFMEINNANFWLGGEHLTRERMWRWDAGLRQIVPSQPAAS